MTKETEKGEEKKEKTSADPKDDVIVDLSQKPEEDHESEVEDKEEKAAIRAEKKRARYDAMLKESREAAEHARAEAARAREENMQMRMEMAKVQGRLENLNPPANPIEAKLENNWKARQDLYDMMVAKASITPDELRAAQAKARQLEREYNEIIVSDAVEKRLAEEKRRQPDPQESYLRSEYREVLNNERGLALVQHHFSGKVAAGAKQTIDLLKESLEYARNTLRGVPPSRTDRARLAGSSAQGADVGGSSEEKIVLGPRQRAMADSTFRSIKDPNERYRKWAERYANVKKSNVR